MLINEMPLPAEPEYDFDLIAPRERIIFFDIETTGLSIAKANIYLIGAVFYDGERWVLRQFFAEGMYDEAKLLAGFFELVNERKKLGRLFLISYNGDGFDIPFISGCIRQYALDFDFSGTLSIDLLKHIRPYRKLAGLENCKLKTVERLCGICREDKYNGGELIYVYEEYLRLAALDEGSCEYNEHNIRLRDALLKTLILHNAEDIMDMPMIMGILGYESLFKGGFKVTRSCIENDVWDIEARLDTPLPRGIYYEDRHFTISISEEDKHKVSIAVSLYNGELRSFYTDYRSYYYLPGEDCAIHKSLGEFVDRKARRQATARTCYQRVSGLFAPEYEAVMAPMFYREYKEMPAYGMISAENTDESGCVDADITKRYIMMLLDMLAKQDDD